MRIGHPAAHCTDSDVGAVPPAAMAVGAVGEAQWTVASGFLGVNAVPSAGGAAGSEVTQHECPWYGFAARTLSRVKCVACGADNKPGRRFCSQCGASLQGLCASCGARYEEGERNGP
jgi:Double zinc ribbon